jgi:hypothetical protein
LLFVYPCLSSFPLPFGSSFPFPSYFIFCYYFPLAIDFEATYFLSFVGSLVVYFLFDPFASFLFSFSAGLGLSFCSAIFFSSFASILAGAF